MSEVQSKAETVRDLFMACLFEEGEPMNDAVMVEGITMTVGFHPGRLSDRRDRIRDIAAQIVTDDFMAAKGGGTSFLNLCVDRDGAMWGEHVNCQELMLLCVGAGLASYCLPRSMWGIFQGAVPYVTFNLS